MQLPLSKLEAIVANGAIGDALGAGYEILTGDTLPKDHAQLPFIQSDNGEPGSVTDDTGMTIAGMVGIERTLETIAQQSLGKPVSTAILMPELLRQTHLAYMQWAANQKAHSGYEAQSIPSYLEKLSPEAFPEQLAPFLHTKGPGPGTLKALNLVATGECDLGSAPVGHFAPGCGGMMRIAPFAMLAAMSKGALDPFTLGMQTAALTHPTPAEACVATGIVCALITQGLGERKTSVAATLHAVEARYLAPSTDDNEEMKRSKLYTRLAIEAAEEVAQKPYSRESANEAAALFFERAKALDPDHRLYGDNTRLNLFYAMPVLTQTVFILLAQEKHGWSVDDTLAAAALHDGDSDSVAAIVGNIIGAKTAETSKRFEMLKPEYQQGITDAAQSFAAQLQQSSTLLSTLQVRGATAR